MPSARVLVAGREEQAVALLTEQLRRTGYVVVAATGQGAEAVAFSRSLRPDVALVDIDLSGDLDGVVTAQHIRDTSQVPVIYLTTQAADPQTVRRASSTEPFGYLARPFGDSQLRMAIEIARYKHAAERNRRWSDRRFAVTLSSIADAVIATDARAHVVFLNPVAADLTGWSPEEALGLPLENVLRVVDERSRATVEYSTVPLRDGGSASPRAALLLSRDGREIAIEDSFAPIVDDGGAITGAVVVFRNVTERRAAQMAEALEQANARFELATEGSNVGIWQIDYPDGDYARGVGRFSSVWKQLGHDKPDAPVDASIAQELVHPEDRATLEAARLAYLHGQTREFQVQVRVLHADGSYHWMLVRGKAERDARGAATSLVGSSVDITDLKRAQGELIVARDMAEAANRAKDEFLANVSHEIRTPMNAILGMTELVLDTELEPSQRRSLRTVHAAAANLLAIINDILDFSRIEAGKLELDSDRFELRVVVDDALHALSVRAQRKGLRLVRAIGEGVPSVLSGDAGRLRQVLINLIGNAVKFTPQGEVAVRVDLAGEVASEPEVELRFSVRDTGIGISPEQQTRVFLAFEQADTSTSRAYGGTGLGLTIAARLVLLMGGRITLESAPGEGSTFSFNARFSSADRRRETAAHVAHSAPSADAPFDASGTLDAQNGAGLAPPEPNGWREGEAPTQAAIPLEVLVAEDNALNAHLIVHLLRSRGHRVRAVKNGLDALQQLDKREYDLMLVDLHMPQLDGFGVVEALRQHEEATGAHLPVVALTARARAEDRERCIAAGMDGFLVKPIERSALWAALDRVVLDKLARVEGRSLIDAPTVLALYDGDESLFGLMRATLTRELPTLLGAVEQAQRTGDLRGLQEAAHTLRGVVVNFSSSLAGLAAQIEEAAARGLLDAAHAPLVRLRALAPTLLRSLEGLSLAVLGRPEPETLPTQSPTATGDELGRR